jgi:hypothetical protein
MKKIIFEGREFKEPDFGNENRFVERKVRTAIKHIAHKNSKLLNEFKEKYPDYNNSSSKISDQYNKIVIESMGGKGDNDYEKESKIIKNLTKEVILEKMDK